MSSSDEYVCKFINSLIHRFLFSLYTVKTSFIVTRVTSVIVAASFVTIHDYIG